MLSLLDSHYEAIYKKKDFILNLKDIESELTKFRNSKVVTSPKTNRIVQTNPLTPILSLGSIPGRKEAQILEQWAKSKIRLVDQKEPGYAKHLNLIYEFVLLELIRQTSVDCSERGAALIKIFTEFKSNNELIIKQINEVQYGEIADLRLQLAKHHEITKTILVEKNEIELDYLASQKALSKQQQLIDNLKAQAAKINEEKDKIEEELNACIRRYDKLYSQAIAAINGAKSAEPTDQVHQPIAPAVENKIKDILIMQHKLSAISPITKPNIEINEKEKPIQMSEVIQGKGINEYSIPKVSKTLRKQKHPLHYHSYTVDDIRFCLCKQTQIDPEIQAPITGEKIMTADRCLSPFHIDGSDESNEDSISITQSPFPVNEKATIGLNDSPTHIVNSYPSEFDAPFLNQLPTNVNIKRTMTVNKGFYHPDGIKSPSKEEVESNVTVSSNSVRMAKFMSLTKIHSIKPLISKKQLIKKEISIIKIELEQKKGCINELTEENLKLSNEIEQLQVKLEEFEKNKKSSDIISKELNNSLTIHNTSNENITNTEEIKELKQIEIYDSPIPDTAKSANKSQTSVIKTICPIPHTSSQLMKDVLDAYKSNKKKFFKSKATLKSLLKMINSVYMGIILYYRSIISKPNNVFSLKGNLAFYLYRHLLNRFGDAIYAKKKFHMFIATALSFKHIPRVHVFCGLLGLTNDIEDSDSAFYIRVVGFLHQLKIGVNILNSDISEKQFIPYVRAVEASRQFFQSNMPKELYNDLIKKLEKKKTPDKNNSNGAIEIDQVLLIMLEQYHILLGKIRNYIYDMFRASDLDKSNSIDFFEFYMIYKYIEPVSYSYESFKTIFSTNSEYNGINPVITFNQFATICQGKSLFSEEAQNKFLNFRKCEEFLKLVEALNNKFDWLYSILSQRLESLLSESMYLSKALNVMKGSIIQKHSPQEAKCVWMMYKLMENMSKELYEERIVESVMGAFDLIANDTVPTTLQLLEIKEHKESAFLFSNQ